MRHILLIDDDQRLAEMLSTYLSARGLHMTHRADALSGIEAVRSSGPDAVILDVMLPDLDGFEVLRRLRASYQQVPVLMLTARGDALDRIVGLELGADDYLPKPFNPRELLARLQAILRRAQPATPTSDRIQVGALSLDQSTRVATVDGRPCALTSYQFDLLWVLASRPGRVQSRDQLLQAVRGASLQPFDRSIDVHISRIRAEVEVDPKAPKRIKTVRGVGYVLTTDA